MSSRASPRLNATYERKQESVCQHSGCEEGRYREQERAEEERVDVKSVRVGAVTQDVPPAAWSQLLSSLQSSEELCRWDRPTV